MKVLKKKKNRDKDWGGEEVKKEELDEIENVAEKKEEKKKELTRKLMYSDSEQVTRRQASSVQRLLNELSKKRLKDAGEISGYLAGKGIKMYDIPKEMYIALASAKVSNTGNVVLNDTIANKPLFFRRYINGYATRTVTNDFLWFQLIFFRELSLLDPREEFQKMIVKLMRTGKVVDAVISSPPFICEKEEDMSKGYYQDFNTDFASIGMQILDEKRIKEIVSNELNKYEFKFEGKEYTAIGTNSSCAIYLKDQKDVYDKIKNTKIFSAFGKFELGPKDIPIKSKAVRYLDFHIKPDSFCPAFLILHKNVNVNLLLKMSLDYNNVFNVMDEIYKLTGQIFYEPEFCYWDTMSQYFEFLFIYCLTSPAIDGEEKRKLKEWIVKYIDLKPSLMIWKQLQLTLEKICIDYYNSFMNRVGYDRLKNLSKKIDKYISDRNRMVNEGNLEEIKQFLEDCPAINFRIRNQFKDNGFFIADYIKQALDKLITNKYENIVKELKDVAIAIYEYSYNPKANNDTELFPILLSEGAFLGSLYDDRSIKNPITEIVKKINKKSIIESVKESKAAKSLANILANVDNYTSKIIESYIYSVYPDASNEDINIISVSISDLIKKNKKLKEKLDTSIAGWATSGSLSKKAYFDFGPYGGKNVIDKYLLDKKQRENEVKREEIDAQINLNDAKQRVVNAKSKLSTVEEEPDDEAIDFVVNFIGNIGPNDKISDGEKNYIATIVYLSNVHSQFTYDELLKMNQEKLIDYYKPDSDVIRFVVRDHKLPTDFDSIKSYTKSEYMPRGITYDRVYVNDRKRKIKKGEEIDLDGYPLKKALYEDEKKDDDTLFKSNKPEEPKKYDKGASRSGRSYTLRTVKAGQGKEVSYRQIRPGQNVEELVGQAIDNIVDVRGRSKSKTGSRAVSRAMSRKPSEKRIVNVNIKPKKES